jgi:hypothetical protein
VPATYPASAECIRVLLAKRQILLSSLPLGPLRLQTPRDRRRQNRPCLRPRGKFARIGEKAPCAAHGRRHSHSDVHHRLSPARRGEPETVGLDCARDWACRWGKTSGKLGLLELGDKADNRGLYEGGARINGGSKASLETSEPDTQWLWPLVRYFPKGSGSACRRTLMCCPPSSCAKASGSPGGLRVFPCWPWHPRVCRAHQCDPEGAGQIL